MSMDKSKEKKKFKGHEKGEDFCMTFDGKELEFHPPIKYPIKKGEWYRITVTRGTV